MDYPVPFAKFITFIHRLIREEPPAVEHGTNASEMQALTAVNPFNPDAQELRAFFDSAAVIKIKPGYYSVSVEFSNLNEKEKNVIATMNFDELTADQVKTVAAIKRMSDFRQKDDSC